MPYSKVNLVPNLISTMSHDGELTLEHVLLALRQEHDEQTANQLTRKLCLQTTSKEISKKGMEFLYMHGHYDDLQQLINKNNESECSSNRKWAFVYQLIIDRKFKRYPPGEILKRLGDLWTDEPELNSLILFIKINEFHGMKEYSNFGNYLEKQSRLFEKIEDRFMLSFFHIRLNQSLFIYYLIRNELIMARKYAFRVLTQTTCPKTKVNMHMSLGLSYIYDTYFQGMYHLSESLKIARAHDLHNSVNTIEQKNIPFLSAHFKKVEGMTSTDKSEQAHIELAKGNYATAEAILSELSIDSPFKLYYLGIAKQDKYILLQSYNSFIESRSDYFFSRLPLHAIREMDD